ncbi:MAG: PKD domain-containing protein [Patescibacteria group bacterium]|mgnify:CR=1 FL=1
MIKVFNLTIRTVLVTAIFVLVGAWGLKVSAATAPGEVQPIKPPTQYYTLTIFKPESTSLNSGSGTVVDNLGKLICGSVCSTSYRSGTSVILTAQPATGSSFVGWSGGCSSSGVNTNTCSILVNSNKTVSALFEITKVNTKPTIQYANVSSSPTVNQPVTFTIKATDSDSPNITYGINWGEEGVYSGPILYKTIPQGTEVTFTHTYTSPKTYTFHLWVADNENMSGNVYKTVPVVVNSLTPSNALADFVVTDIKIEKRSGDTKPYIYTTVKNKGGTISSRPILSIVIKDLNTGKLYGAGTTDNYTAGWTKEISAGERIVSKPNGRYRLSATVDRTFDGTELIAESNENNNNLVRIVYSLPTPPTPPAPPPPPGSKKSNKQITK